VYKKEHFVCARYKIFWHRTKRSGTRTEYSCPPHTTSPTPPGRAEAPTTPESPTIPGKPETKKAPKTQGKPETPGTHGTPQALATEGTLAHHVLLPRSKICMLAKAKARKGGERKHKDG